MAVQFAAFIGIDWADRKHDVCLQVTGADSATGSSTPMRRRVTTEAASKEPRPRGSAPASRSGVDSMKLANTPAGAAGWQLEWPVPPAPARLPPGGRRRHARGGDRFREIEWTIKEAVTTLIIVSRSKSEPCPVARTLDIVGDRWTILILRDLLANPSRRFQELETSLRGISPNTLSARLKNLEEHAIVARRLYEEHPPRAEYVLTPKGRELGPALQALLVWGRKHTG